jgi:hypothetical protein
MYSLLIAFSSAGKKPFSAATVKDPELLLTTARPASRSSSVPQFRLLASRWGLGVAGAAKSNDSGKMAVSSGASGQFSAAGQKLTDVAPKNKEN